MNKVFLTGNLTRTPELKATAGGTDVLAFGLAVNDRRKNARTGVWEDHPNFIDCTMFGARAKSLSRYLDKGSRVAIVGRLFYSSWEKDGQKRSKLEVTVEDLEFAGSKSKQNDADILPEVPEKKPEAISEVYREDIPF